MTRFFVAVLLFTALGCDSSSTVSSKVATAVSPPMPAAPPLPAKSDTTIRLRDATAELGINFKSYSGTSPVKTLPTSNGTGIGVLDFDLDGWLDIYSLNATRLEEQGPTPPNVLLHSRSGSQFQDVSVVSQADVSGFNAGVASGDVNADGWPDLYLVRFGPNVMLQNNGDGTFTDVTAMAQTDDDGWGTSAAFLDYDGDGNLDLYTVNYGHWDLKWHEDHYCTDDPKRRLRMYCSPNIITPQEDRFYRSSADGRFIEISESLGIRKPDGRGQGVVAADLNNDLHIDLYIANDLTPNYLFINDGKGGFEDHTDLSGAAYDSRGNAQAGMGVDAGDIDRDGLLDLFVTNFVREYNTLYRNIGDNLYVDDSTVSRLAADSIPWIGWGTALVDLDCDGWLDILVVNGHLDDNLHEVGRNEPYLQPPVVWRNLKGKHFENVGAQAGEFFETEHVSRGAAFGDLNNDGYVDVVISHKDETPSVLLNEHATDNHWIVLDLVGYLSHRDAVGCHIVARAGSETFFVQVQGGRSYMSSNDKRVLLGVGSVETLDEIEIRWPSGMVSTLKDVRTDQALVVRERLH